jgi:alpha-ketoglutarate-dependent 2,4-dichlorophenoxyacetate dioxygenase
MLSARVIPDVRADTEFADMRSAWDALDEAAREKVAPLSAHHSVTHSREILGFSFTAEEHERLQGAVQPLVKTNPRTGRRSLCLASHASCIIGWPVPEGRLLLADLMAHATQRQFVHRHAWRDGDFVIWDNLATMHRATAFDDIRHRRELRRVTTLDIPLHATTAAAA